MNLLLRAINNLRFGKFSGPIRCEWLNSGREMKLIDSVCYKDQYRREWYAPSRSIINGASIPRVFWSIIGGPFDDLYRNASVFHDVACQQRARDWQRVHRMFYNAMRCSGVSKFKARIMFSVVYQYGPRWRPMGPLEYSARQMVCLDEAVEFVKRIEESNLTIKELEVTLT